MLTNLDFVSISLDLNLVVTSLDLGECFSFGNSHNDSFNFQINFKFTSLNHPDTMYNKGFTKREIESFVTVWLIFNSSDSSDD